MSLVTFCILGFWLDVVVLYCFVYDGVYLWQVNLKYPQKSNLGCGPEYCHV